MAVWIGPALKAGSTFLSMIWTYVSGKLNRQKSALGAAREARDIDSDVDRMPDSSVRDKLRSRLAKRK